MDHTPTFIPELDVVVHIYIYLGYWPSVMGFLKDHTVYIYLACIDIWSQAGHRRGPTIYLPPAEIIHHCVVEECSLYKDYLLGTIIGHMP